MLGRASRGVEPIFGRILHLKGGGHAGAIRGRTAAGGVQTVDFLNRADIALSLVLELEPSDGRRVRSGGGDGRDFLQVNEAERAKVKGGGGGVAEVVFARGHELGRDAGDGDAEGFLGQGGEDGGVADRDAGRVVERGHGADGGRDRGRGGVGARVVLRAASDGDVVDGEAGGRRRQRRRRRGLRRALEVAFGEGRGERRLRHEVEAWEDDGGAEGDGRGGDEGAAAAERGKGEQGEAHRGDDSGGRGVSGQVEIGGSRGGSLRDGREGRG